MMNPCLILLILTSTRPSSARLNSFDDKDIHNQSEQQNVRVRQSSIQDFNSGWWTLIPFNVHTPATPDLRIREPTGVTLNSGSLIVTRNEEKDNKKQEKKKCRRGRFGLIGFASKKCKKY